MTKQKITEEVRKELKRQPVEPDVQTEAQVTEGTSNPSPVGNQRNEGSGNPGGHGRGGKTSRS